MSIFHVRRRDLFKNDFATGLRFTVITGDAKAIELERQRNSPEQIGHEHQTAVQHRNNRQLFVLISFGDLRGDLIESPMNRQLIKEDALEVALHGCY